MRRSDRSAASGLAARGLQALLFAGLISITSADWGGPALAETEPAECRTCLLTKSLATKLNDKADKLETQARSLAAAARSQNDPKTLRWPGPARMDSDATIWTRQQQALARSRAAARADHVADGVATLAAVAARASDLCGKEMVCRSAEVVRAHKDAPACAVFDENMAADLDSILAPVQATTAALETDALTCSAMPCPGAECDERHALLESAAFAEGILSAATGEVAVASNADGVSEEGDDTRTAPASLGVVGVTALSHLTSILTPQGLDALGTQRLAGDLAELERKLLRPVSPGQQTPRWRRVAARLALAGMRDALGSLRLEARLGERAAWDHAASRLEATLKAMMRLETAGRRPAVSRSQGTQSTITPAASCPGVDPRLTRTLFRLRRAVNSAAICSVRSGCSAQQAIDEGAARAADLIASPVLDPQLELIKVLAEEVSIAPSRFEAARAVAEPAPQISLNRDAYQQGAAMELTLSSGNNRCLASGGHVALLRADEATGAPASSLDQLEDAVEKVPVAGQEQAKLLLRAPHDGTYNAAVYAGAAEGGALLAAIPLRVTGPEPAWCEGWTGVWQTEFGRLVTIEHENGDVSGTYGRTPDVPPGFVFGRLSGTRLDGVWISEISSGGTRLRLQDEGVFRGSWGLAKGQVANGGKWSGICIAASTDETADKTAPQQGN